MALSKSGIPYISHWQVAVGCTRGCTYCWARTRWAPRMRHRCELCGDFVPHVHEERLDDVTPKQKPKVIGLGFFTDVFGAFWESAVSWPTLGFSSSDGGPIFRGIKMCPQHTFVIPTRCPENIPDLDWPDNAWLLVTCTTQAEIDERLPAALDSGFQHVVVNLEPMLGPVDLSAVEWLSCSFRPTCNIAGVILGGQSGPGAPPLHPDHVRSVRDQCATAGVCFYFKQPSAADKDWPMRGHMPLLDGGVHDELPWKTAGAG